VPVSLLDASNIVPVQNADGALTGAGRADHYAQDANELATATPKRGILLAIIAFLGLLRPYFQRSSFATVRDLVKRRRIRGMAPRTELLRLESEADAPPQTREVVGVLAAAGIRGIIASVLRRRLVRLLGLPLMISLLFLLIPLPAHAAGEWLLNRNSAEPVAGAVWRKRDLIRALELGAPRMQSVEFATGARGIVATEKSGVLHLMRSLPPSEEYMLMQLLRAKRVGFTVVDGIRQDILAPADSFFQILMICVAMGMCMAMIVRLASRDVAASDRRRVSDGPGALGVDSSRPAKGAKTSVTFSDVAGCESSKLELEEVVDFLHNPERFNKVGARCPRGVLLEGPPGTGKTLLARAVAGEAGVPFYQASGSQFVEIYVGQGAKRVRSLFRDAKKHAPSVVFIDEIDAIGRKRGGRVNGNDEREQTLNQLLTEMDGFGGNSGVIVVAATNRSEILDDALLRPGRFDRRVPVHLPDVKGRTEILKVHTKTKPLATEVSLEAIAGQTIGFSGASLENLMNEAAIFSARRGKKIIGKKEVADALDRITVGLTKAGSVCEANKKILAYHEAGHAVMASQVPGYDEVSKVTIVPRSNGAGGFTAFTPSAERLEMGLYSYSYLKGQLAVALGGRIAEELTFGRDEITTGASNDLQQVRNIATRMVTQWGFASDELSLTAWSGEDGGYNTMSERQQAKIDASVQALVDEAAKVCRETLEEQSESLHALANELLRVETVDAEDFKCIMRGEPIPTRDPEPEVELSEAEEEDQDAYSTEEEKQIEDLPGGDDAGNVTKDGQKKKSFSLPRPDFSYESERAANRYRMRAAQDKNEQEENESENWVGAIESGFFDL
jgi:cell division protease FtsH